MRLMFSDAPCSFFPAVDGDNDPARSMSLVLVARDQRDQCSTWKRHSQDVAGRPMRATETATTGETRRQMRRVRMSRMQIARDRLPKTWPMRLARWRTQDVWL